MSRFANVLTKIGAAPEAVARKLGLSYETFRKKFRSAIGFSPGRYHHDSRIDRAAALLHQGRFTIEEIAELLEFCDEFYFSRCFKRRFGDSPRAFRQRGGGSERTAQSQCIAVGGLPPVAKRLYPQAHE